MSEIDTSKLEWDFSNDFFLGLDERIELEKKKILDNVKPFISKWIKRKDYLEDATLLKEALDELGKLETSIGTRGDIGFFMDLLSEKDQSNVELKAKLKLFEDFANKLDNELSFFVILLSKVSTEKQDEFLRKSELTKYRSFLRRIFRDGKHTLSEQEEKILNLKRDPAKNNWTSMVSEFLSSEVRMVFTGDIEEELNFSSIQGLLSDSNKKVRDSARDAENSILKKHEDVAVYELNSILQNKMIDDELRGYSRSDESRIVNEDIDFEFIDSLLSSVKSKSEVSRRFYELKAKLFGLSKLEYHERNLVYGDIDKEYNYEDSIGLVYDSFKNFDSEFADIFKRLIESGNIDVYPAKGKRGGAFCAARLISQPTYILLNHTNKLRDVETIAHELGHAINFEMMKSLNPLDFDVPMGTAETASNFCENIFFSGFLSKVSNDEEKLAIMMLKLNGYISSVVRQIFCYNFELELHDKFRKKGHLSKEDIGEIFHRNMEEYMGDFVEYTEESKSWWVAWTHIRSYFYVYSYSGGLLMAMAMLNKYNEDPKFIKEIKYFFSAGRSESPREILGNMGITLDKEFWNKGLLEIENLLDETWVLAEKLGKI